jgi:hypothetical protein
VCINYDTTEIEIHGKKKTFQKRKVWEGEEPIGRKAPSDRSLTSGAPGLPGPVPLLSSLVST